MVISDNGDDTTLITFESNEESQEDNNKQVNHPGKRVQRDKWLIFPTKTIQEMVASTQVSILSPLSYIVYLVWVVNYFFFNCLG